MLRAIYEIGKAIVEDGKVKPEEQFVDKAKLNNKTKTVLYIVFNIVNGVVEYKNVEVDEYEEIKALSALYKSGSSRGTDVMPSSIIAKDATKTFENKILLWFKNNHDEDKLFEDIYKALSENKERIEEELSAKYGNIEKTKRQNVLLTLKIVDGNKKYLSDYDIFRKWLLSNSKQKYYYLSSMGESKGEGICYLCGKQKEVYGFVLPAFGFSFSTADKPGFVPGFNKEWMWKEIPICEDCAITLEVGKKYIDENLSYGFYGNKYYVIPQVVIPEKSKEVLSESMDMIEIYKGK